MGGIQRRYLLLFYLVGAASAMQHQQPNWLQLQPQSQQEQQALLQQLQQLQQQPNQQPFPQVPAPQTIIPTFPTPTQQLCNDKRQCSYWTKNGFCNHTFYNEHYKKEKCANACGLCSNQLGGSCVDTIQGCSNYISLGYCTLPAGQQTCCATCSNTRPTTAPTTTGGVDINSILGGLGGLIPGLGGGTSGSGGGQQPQTGGNPLGALGSILGGLTGGGGQSGGSNPLSALGNVLGGSGSGGGANPLSAITNGLGSLGNLANLAGMLG